MPSPTTYVPSVPPMTRSSRSEPTRLLGAAPFTRQSWWVSLQAPNPSELRRRRSATCERFLRAVWSHRDRGTSRQEEAGAHVRSGPSVCALPQPISTTTRVRDAGHEGHRRIGRRLSALPRDGSRRDRCGADALGTARAGAPRLLVPVSE